MLADYAADSDVAAGEATLMPLMLMLQIRWLMLTLLPCCQMLRFSLILPLMASYGHTLPLDTLMLADTIAR